MNNCRLQITRKFLLSSQVQGNMNQLDFGDTLTLAFVGSICSDSRCFFMSLGAMSYNTGSDFRSALVSSLGSHHQNNESTSEGRRWHLLCSWHRSVCTNVKTSMGVTMLWWLRHHWVVGTFQLMVICGTTAISVSHH